MLPSVQYWKILKNRISTGKCRLLDYGHHLSLFELPKGLLQPEPSTMKQSQLRCGILSPWIWKRDPEYRYYMLNWLSWVPTVAGPFQVARWSISWAMKHPLHWRKNLLVRICSNHRKQVVLLRLFMGMPIVSCFKFFISHTQLPFKSLAMGNIVSGPMNSFPPREKQISTPWALNDPIFCRESLRARDHSARLALATNCISCSHGFITTIWVLSTSCVCV